MCHYPYTHTHTAKPHSIKELEFPREDNAVGELVVAMALLHVLEPLEVQCKDLRQLLHPQSLGGLLLATAFLAIVLAISTQRLIRGEHPVVE